MIGRSSVSGSSVTKTKCCRSPSAGGGCGVGVVHSACAWPYSYDHRPSHPYSILSGMLHAVLVIWPLTTHPVRDGAPFLLLMGTPPTFGCSFHFFHADYYIKTWCLSYPLPVWLSVAIIHLGAGWGGVLKFVHVRSRMAIGSRIPTMPGRSTSGFHQPGRHCLHQARSAVRCLASRMKGELHPSKNRS